MTRALEVREIQTALGKVMALSPLHKEPGARAERPGDGPMEMEP